MTQSVFTLVLHKPYFHYAILSTSWQESWVGKLKVMQVSPMNKMSSDLVVFVAAESMT